MSKTKIKIKSRRKSGSPTDEELLDEIDRLRQKRDKYRERRIRKQKILSRERGERVTVKMSEKECDVRTLLKRKENRYYSRQLRDRITKGKPGAKS